MMAAIMPEGVAENHLTRHVSEFLELVHLGKVRHTYALPDHPELFLVVATDRISIYDYILNALVTGKGRVLTQVTVNGLTRVLRGIKHHLLSYGRGIDNFLPAKHRGYPALWDYAMVVKKLEMVKIEAIARGYITGSGYRDYVRTGEVCGIKLPPGLSDSDELPVPLFTPSTKSEDGHDENITEAQAAEIVGPAMVKTIKRLTLTAYSQMHAYWKQRGIIVADTKFEFGIGKDGEIYLADEFVTPDSSRFWPLHGWCTSPLTGKPPSGFDKEPIRQEGTKALLPDGRTIDISKLKNPMDPTETALVHSWVVPKDVLTSASNRYDQLARMME